LIKLTKLLKLTHPMLRFVVKRFMFPPRINYLEKCLVKYMTSGEEMLDIGAGDGKLAARIANKTSVRIVGCDVVLQPEPEIKVVAYDGVTLPFADNSFECVMLVDMLHHLVEQDKLLLEAKRVSRGKVLIKDHYWESRFDWMALVVMDYIGNVPFGIDLPCRYLREEQWLATIERLGCKIVDTERFRFNFADPIKHVVFMLEYDSLSGPKMAADQLSKRN